MSCGGGLPGISPHTLTRRLRRFETYGIVTRTVYAEVPPRVEYELTPLGREIKAVLDAMAAWAVRVPDPRSATVAGWSGADSLPVYSD